MPSRNTPNHPYYHQKSKPDITSHQGTSSTHPNPQPFGHKTHPAGHISS